MCALLGTGLPFLYGVVVIRYRFWFVDALHSRPHICHLLS